jgi:hypothetical protein
MTTAQYHLNGKPVQILQTAERGQVLVETTDGLTILVHKSGLAVNPTRRPVSIAALKIDNSRGTDGAR